MVTLWSHVVFFFYSFTSFVGFGPRPGKFAQVWYWSAVLLTRIGPIVQDGTGHLGPIIGKGCHKISLMTTLWAFLITYTPFSYHTHTKNLKYPLSPSVTSATHSLPHSHFRKTHPLPHSPTLLQHTRLFVSPTVPQHTPTIPPFVVGPATHTFKCWSQRWERNHHWRSSLSQGHRRRR